MKTDLLMPLFAMFSLTVCLSLYMLFVRIRDAKSGKMDPRYFLTYDSGKPSLDVVKTQRHYSNLFELPVLYYVAVLAAMILGLESQVFLILAWAFVGTRVVHLLIHVGPNRIYWRMSAFFSGFAVLVVMWIMLLVAYL